MRLRLFLVASVLWTAFVLSQAEAQQPPSKTTLRMRLVDDITQNGIPGARITLTGASPTQPMALNTDDAGKVLFTDLPIGTYSMAIDKTGYFAETVSGINVVSTGTDLHDCVLIARRSVAGVLKWDDGEPVVGATISVMSYIAKTLSRTAVTIQGQTNDKGEFRIEGLRPRHYLIFASLNPGAVRPGTAPRLMFPTMPPGVTDFSLATPFDLRATRDISDVRIVAEEKTGVEVEGTVTAATLPAGTRVQVALTVPFLQAPPMLLTTAMVGQKFRFPQVPPGTYQLWATGTAPPPAASVSAVPPPPAIPAGTTLTPELLAALLRSAQAAQGGQAEQHVGGMTLNVVAGQPIHDLSVYIPTVAPIEGKVELQKTPLNGPAETVPAGNFGVIFEQPKLGQPGVVMGRPNPQGEFRLTGFIPGEMYQFGPPIQPLLATAYLAQMTQGGNDLALGTLPIKAGGGPVRVLLKDDGGQIEGRVTNGNKPPKSAFVVLAPKNREVLYWYRLTNSSSSDGYYKLTAIPPGDYDLFALDQNEEDMYRDPAFLRQFSTRSTPVHVDARSSRTTNLEVIETPKN